MFINLGINEQQLFTPDGTLTTVSFLHSFVCVYSRRNTHHRKLVTFICAGYDFAIFSLKLKQEENSFFRAKIYIDGSLQL
jgi:hypothetical protein